MDNNFNPYDYWQTRLSKKNNLEGVGYSALGMEFNIWAYKTRKYSFKLNLERLGINLKGKKVADIGAGSGFWIDTYRELGAESITGADLTDAAVENLRNSFPYATFVKADIGENEIPDGLEKQEYDAVSCMDVLFHIVDDNRFAQAVANIASLVKPGGYFIYSDMFLKNNRTVRVTHQVMHSEEFLLDLFAKNGLEVVARKPFLYLSNTPVSSNNALIKGYWFIIYNTLRYLKFMGYILGPLTYAIEKYYIKNSSFSPSTEITILRKK